MPSVTKKNIASGSSSKPRKTRKDSKKLKSRQLDFLGFIDDSVGYSELIPYSNRFHLSAARDTARKVELGGVTNTGHTNYITESAAINSPKTAALMDETLTYLDDPKLLKQFKTNEKEDRRIIIAENNYDDTTLWRIHDAYRTDGAVSRSLDTMVEAVVGRKRTSLILDTNDYYDNEDDELEALDEIKNNELYRKYVRDISKINKHLNMNTFEKMILSSVLIYGRAAILIEYDKDPLKYKDALPIALKSLASLRIGRTFYYEDTWELAGIEYLDFKENTRIVEPHRLIYYVNKDYHLSPRTLHNGYSILEPVLDIAETNTLNRQTNIKEINKRLWAAFIIIKYFGKKKKDVENFIKNYKAGMPIIGNRDFEAQALEIAHDLDKLIAQGLDADKKIARDLKIPIMLTGHDNEQAMATAGTVIHSWINFVLESARTDFRNVFEKQWIERILLALINKNKELDTFLALIKDSDTVSTTTTTTTTADSKLSTTNNKPINKNTKDTENDNTGNDKQKSKSKTKTSDLPQGFIVSDKENKILNPIDLPFKIKLQFANFTIDTFLDKIAGVKALVDSGIITKIMALTELDRKEYIPEMRAVIEEEQLQFQEMMQQENDFRQQDLDNKSPANKNNPKLPKVDSKATSQADINNRKTKSSSAGSNNTLRS